MVAYPKMEQFMKITSKSDITYSESILANPTQYHPYEFETIDWMKWYSYVYRHQNIPIYTGIIYISLIFGIQYLMKNRKPFVLKKELFLWNAALGIFSVVGFIRFVPELLGLLRQPGGLYTTLCVFTPTNIPRIYWSLLFVLSKYVELGDTIFIVLRKKPLQFIQWYHHITTLAVVWVTLAYFEPIGLCYIPMNFGVHSLMYPYFALKALDIKIPRQIAKIITTLQFVQMILGLLANTYTTYVHYFGTASCYRREFSMQLFFLLYGSFVVLFGRLFYKLVMARKSKSQ